MKRFRSAAACCMLATIALTGALTPSVCGADTPPVVVLSPTVRAQTLQDNPPTPLAAAWIAPFLAAPLILEPGQWDRAAQVLKSREGRVLLSQGDYFYARAPAGTSAAAPPGIPWRLYRNPKALINPGPNPDPDPDNPAVLGVEVEYLGSARLMQSEADATGELVQLRIESAVREIRAGDRLIALPAPPPPHLVPHAPGFAVTAQVIALYASDAIYAGQNQIVVINQGRTSGLEVGHRLTIQNKGAALVFMTFGQVSYALITHSTDVVLRGDVLHTPTP